MEGRLEVGVRSVKVLLLLLLVRASSEEEAVRGLAAESGNAADAGDRRLLEVGLAAGAGFRAAAAEASTGAVLCEEEGRTAVLVADVTAPAGCC